MGIATKGKGKTYKKSINGLRDLVLGPRDRDNITGKLSTGELNLAVPFLLKLIDF